MHIKVRRGVAPDNGASSPDPEPAMHTVIPLDVARALRTSRQRQRPLAVTLHWPGTPSAVYRSSLAQQIRLIGGGLGSRQPVEHFQWRGAAPIGDVQMQMQRLRERMHFLEHDRGDYAIDLAPQHSDWASVGRLRELGFNRVCIGVPDACTADPLSQDTYRDPAPIQSLIDAARTFGFRSVSVDLGYGNAWQTLASLEAKLASLIALEPDRVQVFDYARPPARYAGQCPQALCCAAQSTAMGLLCVERLEAAGYHYLGLGQFARGDDELTQAQERGRLRRTEEGFTLHGDCSRIGLGLFGRN
ncbi:coproporphyrinogen III oxidase [Pseudomonas allii]|uniref:Coproporphyrinogen III oxidase n=1 Tax=Pseudomonas allii TaxID=2740531 RepID=A0ACC6LIQ1_9PSED|nr:coproporphyrinogen III oxidase [Pseudomonas allii]MDR9878368.1 coproporphyrinogen III oxidase [Pseudomonas allii]